MKKLMFFFIFALSIFSFKSEAQYWGGYGNYWEQNMIQRFDLGPYGYGQMQDQIMRFGMRYGYDLYRQQSQTYMNLFGRQFLILQIKNLRLTRAGSMVWIDYYLNGINIGRTDFVGRMGTTIIYRQNVDRAMYRRYW